MATYGISDEEAAGVGLMCGGTVRIFVHEQGGEALDVLDAVAAAREAGEPVALATLLDGDGAGAKLAILGDRVVGSLGVTELLDRSVERDARGQLDEGLSRVRRYGAGGEVMGSEVAVYIQAFETQPRMVIFGAIDFSAEMAKLASEVGYQVTICDARGPSPTARASRASRRWSSTGLTATWRARSWARATWCWSSPTTRNSTSPR